MSRACPALWKPGVMHTAHLYGYAAHRFHGVARQLLIDVVDVLGELCGDLKGVRLVCDGCQDVQLQRLDVAGLILAAVERGVYLRTYMSPESMSWKNHPFIKGAFMLCFTSRACISGCTCRRTSFQCMQTP